MDLRAISRQVFKQEANTSHVLFPSFGYGENIFRQISGTTEDTTRERWNAPALEGFSTRDWWDKKESDVCVIAGSRNKESIPGIFGSVPARGTSVGGQFANTPHQTRRVGPPVCIFLV